MRSIKTNPTLALFMSATLIAATGIAPYSAVPDAWADPDEEAQVDEDQPEEDKDIDSMTSDELEEEATEVKDRISAMQQEADAASEAYFKALEEKEEAERLATDAQSRIDSANAKIEKLQEDLGRRAVDLYKNGDGFDHVQILLESKTLAEFLDKWHYLTCVANSDAKMIDETESLKEDVVKDKMIADEQAALAQTRASEADQTKKDTEAKIAEYEAYLDTLDEKVKEKAREEAAAAAAAQASYSSSSGGGGISYSAGTDIPANGSVVDYAYSRLGCPYVWASGGPNSFDCSGLVMWCYAQVGIDLPHYTGAQYSAAKAVLPLSAAEPGDVLYMDGHVGICIESGGGAYIHAPTPGDVVRVSTWPMFTCALRF